MQRLLVVKRMKPLGLLEQTAHPDELASVALGDHVERLREYAERADERIERLESDIPAAVGARGDSRRERFVPCPS